MTLAWVDLETTGLDPDRDDILEIALVLTNEKLEVLSSTWCVVNPWQDQITASQAIRDMDGVVYDMHTENGLLVEVWDEGIPMEEAEHRMMESVAGRGVLTLAGSSVHFDRGFLSRWMPGFVAQCSHRHVDVSVAREMAKMWTPGLMETFPLWLDTHGKTASDSNHRAMSDITRSIDLARFFREAVFASGF